LVEPPGECRSNLVSRRSIRAPTCQTRDADAPFLYTAKKFAETGDASLIWEGHKAGRRIGYCHIEKLHNLQMLPSKGFMISCFPVKVAHIGRLDPRSCHRRGMSRKIGGSVAGGAMDDVASNAHNS
jgi:hypothetical protein